MSSVRAIPDNVLYGARSAVVEHVVGRLHRRSDRMLTNGIVASTDGKVVATAGWSRGQHDGEVLVFDADERSVAPPRATAVPSEPHADRISLIAGQGARS